MLYGAMNFPIRPVLEELHEIADLGFDYLELTMDAPQAHHSLVRKQRKEIRKALGNRDMGLICHLPTFVNPADLTPRLREASRLEVLDSLETAAELGALKVVLHPSPLPGLSALVPGEAKGYAMESLSTIIERADKLDLSVCLENLFPQTRSLVEPEDFREVLNRFPRLRVTLDTGHANIGYGGDRRFLAFVQNYTDRIGHVHASDNFGKEDNHLPIGAGLIDFPKIIRALRHAGYDETITLEVFSRDRDYLKISREKITAMVAEADLGTSGRPQSSS